MRKLSQLVVRRRVAFLFLLATGCLFFLAGRLFWVQVIKNSFLTSHALEQRLHPVPIDPRRGTIYDRNGEKLAVSISADAVYVIPAEVGRDRRKAKENAELVARRLAQLLHMEDREREILEKVQRRSSSEWIKKKVPPDQARAVREADLPGVGVVENPQRFYPNHSLAAQVLGIAGIDNQGLEGIEVAYDRYLKGLPGRVEAERDAHGNIIPGGIKRYIPPRDGADLYLTIDKVIQYIAERELGRALKETGAKKGVVLVVRPKTGEILALANLPSFDPNDYPAYPAEKRRNTAICDTYEPGSTFKVITAATALEERVTTPERQFHDPGFLRIGKHTIHCWRDGGHGTQTFVEGVENSCNTVFGTLGMEIGEERFYNYIRAFGFGQPTGIDFPGEADGVVHVPGSIALVGWVNVGFGQGITVTPLQLLMAVSAVANDGRLMRPYLVKEIRGAKGERLAVTQPTEVRQVISAATAREMRRILRSVVVNGSGKRADVPGYRPAGKTGTAQVAEAGGYSHTKVVASFVGFAPFDDPEVAVLVALYEPTCGVTFGGVIAAPVFQAVVRDTLSYLRVPPVVEPKEKVEEDAGAQVVVVPNARNYPRGEATTILGRAGLSFGFVGEGEIVVDQVPKPGARVARGTRVVLHTAGPLKPGDGLNPLE
ncbi:MAG: penicillin-binding transpeptidase domain-containing protein [Bacillota bacterium]|nr:penicillin-binding transpeptidase domain-containing protein [Bacillota bacterium]